MKKYIKDIQENDNFEFDKADYAGYIITLIDSDNNEKTIKLGIDNQQCCCESFGYLMSEDNLDEFIGAEFLSAKVTDTALKNYNLEDFDCGGIMFVTFETSKGTFQFVAYNEHNGYYGHDVIVDSDDLKHTEYL